MGERDTNDSRGVTIHPKMLSVSVLGCKVNSIWHVRVNLAFSEYPIRIVFGANGEQARKFAAAFWLLSLSSKRGRDCFDTI